MDIKLIKSAEDAIQFAEEEFIKRGIKKDYYKLSSLFEITDEIIELLQPGMEDEKMSNGWYLIFTLNTLEGFELKHISFRIYVLLEAYNFYKDH